MSHQQSGVLRVKLTHALGLKSMDSNGYSDPYCKVSFGKQTHKSQIVKKSLNPRWDETYTFRGNYPDFVNGVLNVECWDWDRLSRNDPLGNGTLQLSHLESQGLAEGSNIVCSVQLKDQQAVPGEVFFEIMWEWDHRPANLGPRGMHPPPGVGVGARGTSWRNPAAYATPHGDQGRIQQTFNYFDANRSGYLDYGELRVALRHYGIDASVLQSAEIVRRYDDKPDGKLEIAEFAELVRDLEQGVLRSAAPTSYGRSPYGGAAPPVPARVAAAFDECDANRSGYLDYVELRTALLRYGMDVSEPMAASMVRAYDDSPDGKLDLHEFARIIKDIEAGSVRREGERRSYTPAGGGYGGYGGGVANGGGGYGGGAGFAPRSPRSPTLRGAYRPSASSRYSSAAGSSSEERGTGAMLYLLDVLFRTVMYALATAALVAPDKVVGDADIVARAAGKESAAQAIATVPIYVWYAILGLLCTLLLVSANCCGLRRPIVACFDCQPGPCSRFCHTIMSCCRPGFGRPSYGAYERYGADEPRYGSYERSRPSYGGGAGYGGGAMKPYERV